MRFFFVRTGVGGGGIFVFGSGLLYFSGNGFVIADGDGDTVFAQDFGNYDGGDAHSADYHTVIIRLIQHAVYGAFDRAGDAPFRQSRTNS